jgi:hypothetical protein
MPIRNQNWYDLQATRRYPLDERSTGEDDNGGLLNDGILVDCHLRFPSTVGNYAFIQGITVTPSLVTVVFGVADAVDDASGPSIAAVTLPLLNVTQNVHYPVRAMVSGVAGWVVFGPGIEEKFEGRYSAPRQTLLSPRCARPYTPLPIPTLKKTGHATSLQGLVQLTAAAPVTCRLEAATVDNRTVQALVFRLEGEVSGTNALQYFLGPCGQRPESNTCAKPAISTINGVAPDCDGNININFTAPDLLYLPFVNCGGGDILGSRGLEEACGDDTNTPRLPGDKCNPSASADSGWGNPIDQIPPDVIESETLPPVETESCAPSPLCVDFDAETQTAFQVIRGLFVFETALAPYGCAGEFSLFETVQEAEENLSERLVYAAANLATTNITLLKNCASDWALGKTFETEIKITSEGIKKNGGIVLNYLSPEPLLGLPERYLVARLDGNRNKLQIWRVYGTAEVVEAETDFVLDPGAWYKLTVTPTDAGGSVSLFATVTGLTDLGPTVSLATALSWAAYGDPTGTAGLHTFCAAAYFTKFAVQG